MPANRRVYRRIRCFLSTTTPKGEGIIDELSLGGGRLNVPFQSAPGEKLLLKIDQQGKGALPVEVLVDRCWKSPVGYRLAWTFSPGTLSRSMTNEFFARVSSLALAAGSSPGSFSRRPC